MKTLSSISYIRIWLIATLALASATSALAKQNDEGRFDFDFPGGSAQELIVALSEASGQSINAMIPPAADAYTMPSLNYKNVTVAQVLGTLSLNEQRLIRTGRNHKNTVSLGYQWEEDRGIWVMRAAIIPEEYPEYFMVKPYNISDLLGLHSIDDITTAIDSAWTLLNVSTENQLLFHPETNILIAKGKEDDLLVMEQVLESMKLNLPSTKSEALPDINVTILGEVNNPGNYTVAANSGILNALGEAGGLSRLANSSKVILTRKAPKGQETQKLTIDINSIQRGSGENIKLQDGDVILIQEKLF